MKGIDRLLLNIGLKAIGSQISNIAKGKLGELLAAIWKPVYALVAILTDKEKDNEAQAKAVLVTELPALIDAVFGIYTDTLLEKINDDSARLLVEFYLTPAREMIKAVADADPEDSAQLKAIVERYKAASFDVSFEYLIGVMEKKMPEGGGKNVLLSILKEVKTFEP